LLKFKREDNQLSLRKFDLRQWVLVTSFEPLVIYSFSDFYLRICGSDFNLHDIGDSYKHLSNYTIQKTNQKIAKDSDELTMS
jgi:tubulin monoglycylase TTLL3/8